MFNMEKCYRNKIIIIIIIIIIHQTGPCLASQSVTGGAGLQDVVGGLRTHAAWAFVWMGNFQSMEVKGVDSVQFSV